MIAKLRSSGFDISAVHNHLMEESPKVLYVHYMGHGPAVQLATSLRAALALSKTPLEKPAAATEESAPAWVKAVEDAVGRKGAFKGGVLSYGVARSDAITMGGMTIHSRGWRCYGSDREIFRLRIRATSRPPAISCSLLRRSTRSFPNSRDTRFR